MAEKCPDISGTQHLSIVIRFVCDLNDHIIDSLYVVREYFLGFIPLKKFDAITLVNKIVELFHKFIHFSLNPV